MKTALTKLVLLGIMMFLLPLPKSTIAPRAQAQAPELYALFAHDNFDHTLLKVDTSTGAATAVGPTNFDSGASGMASSRGRVPGPGGVLFADGMLFGLFRDEALGADFVTVMDVTTGRATKVVQTQRPIAPGRGIAFGPDGVTLYVIEGPSGVLSIIDTTTGAVTKVGDTGFAAASLEWDPDTNSFLSITADNSLIRIDPTDASATLIGSSGSLGPVTAFRGSTVVRSPTGTWYTINVLTGDLVTIDVNTGTIGSVVGNLGSVAQAPDGRYLIGATVFAPAALADLAITKTDDLDPTAPGGSLTYTLNVTNSGPSNATGVTLTDTLPPEVTFVSATPSQGSCSESGGTVTCALGNLAVDGSATVEIVVTVDPALADGTTLTNTAGVVGSEPDPDLSNNIASEETRVARQADLAVTKTDDPDPAASGGDLTYTLSVTNNGPSDATGVTLTDTLPTGVTFVSATPSQGSCSESGGTVTCTLGDLAVDGSAAVEIVVTLDPTLADGTTLTNTAEVAGNEPDPNPDNNTATEETQVVHQADLGVTKTGTPNPVTAGNQITYTLTVTNYGPSDASGVTVTDTLPAGVRFTSGSPGCAETTPGVVACEIGDLAAGDTVTVDIVVTLEPDAIGMLTDTAEVGGNEPDPNPDNNTDTEETAVPADFGDAADPPYHSLVASGGAFHRDSSQEWLGLGVTSEFEAKVPDLDEFDDGVALRPWLRPFRLVRVPILISTADPKSGRYGREPERRLYLRGWVDYNRDGDWDDPGELVVDCDVAPGTMGQCNGRPAPWLNAQSWQRFEAYFVVGLVQEGPTWARFRLSYGAPVGPTGGAAYGEVEDYQVTIGLQDDP